MTHCTLSASFQKLKIFYKITEHILSLVCSTRRNQSQILIQYKPLQQGTCTSFFLHPLTQMASATKITQMTTFHGYTMIHQVLFPEIFKDLHYQSFNIWLLIVLHEEVCVIGCSLNHCWEFCHRNKITKPNIIVLAAQNSQICNGNCCLQFCDLWKHCCLHSINTAWQQMLQQLLPAYAVCS